MMYMIQLSPKSQLNCHVNISDLFDYSSRASGDQCFVTPTKEMWPEMTLFILTPHSWASAVRDNGAGFEKNYTQKFRRNQTSAPPNKPSESRDQRLISDEYQKPWQVSSRHVLGPFLPGQETITLHVK